MHIITEYTSGIGDKEGGVKLRVKKGRRGSKVKGKERKKLGSKKKGEKEKEG